MNLPIVPELAAQLAALSPTQLAWLSGYAWAQSQQSAVLAAEVLPAAAATPVAARRVRIVSASQTGNARRVAEALHQQLAAAGVTAQLTVAADFKSKSLPEEDILLLITSTQGEGEPPEEALPLYKFLFGKKAPQLAQLQFAVLALGDSSYPKFCQAGKDFDQRLEALGAQRLLARTDCDLDYQAAADAWLAAAAAKVAELAAASAAAPVAAAAGTPAATGSTATYDKNRPFAASVNVGQKITARNAAKDVRHIEIDLSGSGIRYQPGDALGVYFRNQADLVAEILQHSGVDAAAEVTLADGSRTSIQAALSEHLDITQNTPALVRAYAGWSEDAALQALADDAAALADYLATTPPVGVLAAHPHSLTAQQLHDLFRPLAPRLYSIASAQAEVDEEVHLTVGVVAFEHHGRHYTGAASGFLAAAQEGDPIRVFVEPNPHFRLPENGDTPIIMIGAGTGVAPFRAFMQQREANGDAGRNWLVFGNQKFTDDFLYQSEWLQYRKSGLLTRADLAWSRQGREKVYVQHKLLAEAAEVWRWLQAGAHVYVCGDASRMARDVEAALLEIIAGQGGLSAEDAEDYLNDLREAHRYQRDVY